MTTKEQLASMLEQQSGNYVSGSTIAAQLGLTRAAVWKCIQQLEEDGYQIEAVKNRGYRLGDSNDAVSIDSIRRYLPDSVYSLDVRSRITSTNTVLKSNASSLPEWSAIIAGYQSEGRGRLGRTFLSPADTGVYLSILLHPSIPAQESYRITTAAAVAACRAIEHCTDAKPSIKWVNDVYVNNRKVCGILTEGAFDMETGGFEWAVMGIGFNVYEPEGGFPEELSQIAGSIAGTRQKDLRSRIAAEFMQEFYSLCTDLRANEFIREYRSRSFLIGRNVNVLKGDSCNPACVLDIDDECRLEVRYENGGTEKLATGEVSIRPV